MFSGNSKLKCKNETICFFIKYAMYIPSIKHKLEFDCLLNIILPITALESKIHNQKILVFLLQTKVYYIFYNCWKMNLYFIITEKNMIKLF